jgi:hypothetical protein
MRAERQAQKGAEPTEGQPQAKRPKKAVSVTPEMEGRQKRAAARMKELQVPPLQVRTCFKQWRPGCTCYSNTTAVGQKFRRKGQRSKGLISE